MTASGQDSIENSNDIRMSKKEEQQAQLSVKFHLHGSGLHKQQVVIPRQSAARQGLGSYPGLWWGLFGEYFGQNTLVHEEFLEP